MLKRWVALHWQQFVLNKLNDADAKEKNSVFGLISGSSGIRRSTRYVRCVLGTLPLSSSHGKHVQTAWGATSSWFLTLFIWLTPNCPSELMANLSFSGKILTSNSSCPSIAFAVMFFSVRVFVHFCKSLNILHVCDSRGARCTVLFPPLDWIHWG